MQEAKWTFPEDRSLLLIGNYTVEKTPGSTVYGVTWNESSQDTFLQLGISMRGEEYAQSNSIRDEIEPKQSKLNDKEQTDDLTNSLESEISQKMLSS